jgi:hypothetical protein
VKGCFFYYLIMGEFKHGQKHQKEGWRANRKYRKDDDYSEQSFINEVRHCLDVEQMVLARTIVSMYQKALNNQRFKEKRRPKLRPLTIKRKS